MSYSKQSYSYSSSGGGDGGGVRKVTKTVTGPDGRTETRTYTYGPGDNPSDDFGDMGFGFDSGIGGFDVGGKMGFDLDEMRFKGGYSGPGGRSGKFSTGGSKLISIEPDDRRGGGSRSGGGGFDLDDLTKGFGGLGGGSGGFTLDDFAKGIPFGKSEPEPAPKKPATRYSKGWGADRPAEPKPISTPKNPIRTGGRAFADIKAQCLREGRLFEDPDFPAVNHSIFYSRPPPRPFEWKRPKELVDNPQLFVKGASRFDVKQGELGDCWLLAAVAALAQHKQVLYQVVDEEQSFEKDYAGIFCFKFWHEGEWTEVYVDDRLPTYYGKLVFMHSADNNEFWTPLIEKAYAKLVGSYEALKGGSASEAMEDFTGGVTEEYDFTKEMPPNMFKIMHKAFERGSFMGCSIAAMPGKVEAELSNGLIMGHAYTITSVKEIEIKTSSRTGKIPMVRVRNPWGNESEWKGAWSDRSKEWNFIPEEERVRIGLVFTDDGEFWMSFQDFSTNFQKVEICNLGPECPFDPAAFKKRWESTHQQGSWKRRVNAGGCRNYLETFWTNPQYRVQVVDADEDDEEDLGTLLIGLLQKGRRKGKQEGKDLLTIGYVIYKIPDDLAQKQLEDPDCGPLDMNFFKYNASVAKSPSFINQREVCGRHKLRPGYYCIIPSTFEPHQEGDFLLRIYSEMPNTSAEIDEETGAADSHPELIRMNPLHKQAGGSIKAQIASTVEGAPVPPPRRGHHKIQAQEAHSVHSKPHAVKDAPSPLDAGKEEELRRAFKKVAGTDMEIDAHELRDILNTAYLKAYQKVKEFKFDGFSTETCRSMVAMMDTDRSGKLGFPEFKKLWNDIRMWKNVFKNHDKDKSGHFNSYELRAAFHSVGFKVSNSTFNALVQRYSNRDGFIYFDDFILCIVRMKTMFDIFREMQRGAKAEFTLDEFVQTTMYS